MTSQIGTNGTSGVSPETASWKRYDLRNRYVLTGKLVMQTAFHIGGGRGTLSNSDSPVVLTPEGLPFIPGSSFKGSLRSTIEKLVPNLPETAGLRTCGLLDMSKDAFKQLKDQNRESTICPTIPARSNDITQMRRDYPDKEDEIQDMVFWQLCNTCLLFGSPYAAARISVSDLYITDTQWGSIIQRRDGVAIDRDSEKAKDRLKYDFEVVPASTTFDMEITLENVTPQDLQLISIGMSEFVHGFGVIGGKRSRGLGVCLLEGLKVQGLELVGDDITPQVRNRRLRDYLLERKFSREQGGEEFLNEHINKIFG
jgi:CRISPR-associated RAMP protein (TIGR02581 family)